MNIKFHGDAPYKIITVHGGPGGAGQLNSLTADLSQYCGIVEALQTKFSIDEQIEELRQQAISSCNTKSVVVGHSWGAWLSMLLAAKHPELVQKLILISCGALQEEYKIDQDDLRLSKLNCNQKLRYKSIIERLSSDHKQINNEEFTDLAKLATIADSYCLLNEDNNTIFNFELFNSVWSEAVELRRSGELINIASKIQCPITIIHGTYDSHPIKGVTEPLKAIKKKHKVIELDKCGHYPWREKFAIDKFFYHLLKELKVDKHK
ncbi:MAG: alpha/beta fold hydrolase [Hyphomicrobiales bacterium]